MTASAYVNGFHQVSLIQTAATIRLNSSTAAERKFYAVDLREVADFFLGKKPGNIPQAGITQFG